jgi:hypothetical protein
MRIDQVLVVETGITGAILVYETPGRPQIDQQQQQPQPKT